MVACDLIVAGGGPAGVSAAVYAASRGLDVVLVEARAIGGVIGKVSLVTHYAAVPDGLSGQRFAQLMFDQLASAGVRVAVDPAVRFDLGGDEKLVACASGEEYRAPFVVLALGTTPRFLGVPGERMYRSMSAVADGPAFAGRTVYVIGGADGAVKEALHLSRIAAKVRLVCVEERLACIAQFRKLVEEAGNIEVVPATRLAGIEGDGSSVRRLRFESVASGEVRTMEDEGCGVFVYAGGTPNTDLVSGQVELRGGRIAVNEGMETSLPGVYAAGDVRDKQVFQVATAVADGCIAGVRASAAFLARS
ncbi:MAG: FAD-dependent oxidoreductase [Berryella intestinalis]|uniref:NAD(P)/FAD-dependent oxidoreductase n=1 Tax=Berryella intestinalis TaxID=1531429 RepID=UPI002A501D82|nr:FAD-dependent oxidoreductase [Berryella intestinalis]MDD7369506.1 FAD-dependent oxidoreductase [Berryella intestinalis]MDY3130084.1 FAD-dependent oxidoreductase [Berryella intestinalis]